MFDPDNDRGDLGRRVDEGSWVRRLDKFTTDAKAQKWLAVTRPSDWATESLEKAKVAYQNPETGQMVKPGDRLDDAYEGVGLPIVEERLAQAGVRLADILNNVFGDRSIPQAIGHLNLRPSLECRNGARCRKGARNRFTVSRCESGFFGSGHLFLSRRLAREVVRPRKVADPAKSLPAKPLKSS